MYRKQVVSPGLFLFYVEQFACTSLAFAVAAACKVERLHKIAPLCLSYF